MKTTVIKQKTVNKEVAKPTKQDIKLDLDSTLAQVWDRELPNGILNSL